ncbi:MAG TPA: hypothetical protein VFD41_11490 [Actinomycetales bacterium]|nr:hypothetical protein [Actinomycetales bacterium]
MGATSPAAGRAAVRRRWPPLGAGQKPLLGASAMVIVGAFLPWLYTNAVGPVSALAGAGVWAFYAGTLGFAGALVPWRAAAVVQAAVMAVAAVGLTLWQLVHLWSLVGFGGWLPGPGLVLVLGGGLLAGSAATRLARGR